jgi:hypothetical protein
MVKTTLSYRKYLFISKLDLNLRKKLKSPHFEHTYFTMVLKLKTLREVDQKYLESFEMWFWRRMGKIIWTDRVRNG